MSSNAKTKRKKSKLDRLLLIKKNIMDSLNLLSKQNKASASAEKRNNTVPKRHMRPASRSANRNEHFRARLTGLPRHYSRNCADQIRIQHDKFPCPGEERLNSSQGQIQTNYQTWPRDEYFLRPFEDQYSFLTPDNRGTLPSRPALPPPINVQVYSLRSETDKVPARKCHSPDNKPLVRHQAIQTDEEPPPRSDVNADIIRYLNQFNDKTAYNLHAPYHLRKPRLFPPNGGYNEQPYRVYPDYMPAKQPHGVAMGHKTLGAQYYHPYVHSRLQCDRVRLPLYEMPPSRSNVHAQLGQLQPSTMALTTPSDQHLLTPPRPDTRISSQDSSSRLSSETDSDFVFFPCTSLAQNFQEMSLMDSSGASVLSPPSDLPENVNTNLSWRSDLYGSSLDDVTFQFFLDEDALSDDVFVDDPATSANDTAAGQEATETLIINNPSACATGPEVSPTQISTGCPSQSNDAMGGYCDNCYTYRYADIDEVLHTIKQSPTVKQHTTSVSSQADKDSPEVGGPGSAHSCPDSDLQSPDDYHPELNPEFANVFDSLRRNSSQTKARQMWRQRRARSNKKTKSLEKGNQQMSHCIKPTIFTFDEVNQKDCSSLQKSPTSSDKPLRGILKNKHGRSSVKAGEDSSANCYETILETDTCGSLVYGQGADLKSPGNSPRALSFNTRRVSPTIIISYVDQVIVSLNSVQSNNTVDCDFPIQIKVKSIKDGPERSIPVEDLVNPPTNVISDHETSQTTGDCKAGSICEIEHSSDVSDAEFKLNSPETEKNDFITRHSDQVREDAFQETGQGDVSHQMDGDEDVSQQSDGSEGVSHQERSYGGVSLKTAEYGRQNAVSNGGDQQTDNCGGGIQQANGCTDVGQQVGDCGELNRRLECYKNVSQQTGEYVGVSQQESDVIQRGDDSIDTSQQTVCYIVNQHNGGYGKLTGEAVGYGNVSQQAGGDVRVSQQEGNCGDVSQERRENYRNASQQVLVQGNDSENSDKYMTVDQQAHDRGDDNQQAGDLKSSNKQVDGCEETSQQAGGYGKVNQQGGCYGNARQHTHSFEDVSQREGDNNDIIQHEDDRRDVSHQSCEFVSLQAVSPTADTVNSHTSDFTNSLNRVTNIATTDNQTFPENILLPGTTIQKITIMDENLSFHCKPEDNTAIAVALAPGSSRSEQFEATDRFQTINTSGDDQASLDCEHTDLGMSALTDIHREEQGNLAMQRDIVSIQLVAPETCQENCGGRDTVGTDLQVDRKNEGRGCPVPDNNMTREIEYQDIAEELNLVRVPTDRVSTSVKVPECVVQKTKMATTDLDSNRLDSESIDGATSNVEEKTQAAESSILRKTDMTDRDRESFAEDEWKTSNPGIRLQINLSDTLMSQTAFTPGCVQNSPLIEQVLVTTDSEREATGIRNLTFTSHQLVAPSASVEKGDDGLQNSMFENYQIPACSTNKEKSDDMQNPTRSNHQVPVANIIKGKENQSLKNYPDPSHAILPSTDQGEQKVVAARKDSLEVHRWNHSTRRRHKLLTRKTKRSSASYQPLRYVTEPFSGLSVFHGCKLTAATL